MIRVVVADELEVLRAGIKSILSTAKDIEVMGEAATVDETLHAVRRGGADVLVTELFSMGRGGIDMVQRIKKECPHLAVFILTAKKGIEFANMAIKVGATGYLTKDASSAHIIEAVRRLYAGQSYFGEEISCQMMTQLKDPWSKSGHQGLTSRELQIFLRIANGETCTAIANALSLSVKTISTHKARIMDKMRLSSVSELVQYALAHELISPYILN